MFNNILLATLLAVSAQAQSLVWHPSTLTLIQEGASYGRMIELPGGKLLCAYSRGSEMWSRSSGDGGKTWSEPAIVSNWPDGSTTNAELLALKDGSILCFFNQRPSSAFGEREGGRILPKTGVDLLPFAIGFARSTDGGATWTDPHVIYEGGKEFYNGCWEPAGVQLPNGEVEVFFANETPYRNSDEQEISMMKSPDGGKTWSPPKAVSFRAGSRDGMPVPLLLSGGSKMLVAIEDNGLSGEFKPVIVSTTLTDDWKRGPVAGNDARRWSALRKPLPPEVYAGAPYLRQLRSGDTVLSFQMRKPGGQERIAVCVGNSQGKSFGEPTFPFPDTSENQQMWASLCALKDGSVMAVGDATINGQRGLWCVRGELKR